MSDMDFVTGNLSTFKNLEFFTGKNPQEIKDQLEQIKIPFNIISMYAQGTSHIVWIRLSKPITKKIKE